MYVFAVHDYDCLRLSVDFRPHRCSPRNVAVSNNHGCPVDVCQHTGQENHHREHQWVQNGEGTVRKIIIPYMLHHFDKRYREMKFAI